MHAVPIQRLLEVLRDQRRQLVGVVLRAIQRHAFRGVHARGYMIPSATMLFSFETVLNFSRNGGEE